MLSDWVGLATSQTDSLSLEKMRAIASPCYELSENLLILYVPKYCLTITSRQSNLHGCIFLS